MVLIADIGNTDTVIGFYPRRKRFVGLRLHNRETKNADQLWLRIRKFLTAVRVWPGHIEGSAISSVVPHLTKILSSVITGRLHTRPLLINGSLDVGLTLRYDNILDLGPDRICSAVAAYHDFGGPVIVVDCGTATTIDVVTAKGEYIGGAIAPGIRTSADALADKTSRLPNVDLRFPARIIARNTITAIQSGVLYSSLDGIEGIVRRIKITTGKKTRVVLTGGFASLIASRSAVIDTVRPTLVLDGAYLIYRRVESLVEHEW